MIERRPKRILSIDYAPAADRRDRPGHPVCEPVWLEPYPDAKLGLEGPAGPDARYEEREGVELTFIPALGHRSHGQTRRRIRDDSQQCR